MIDQDLENTSEKHISTVIFVRCITLFVLTLLIKFIIANFIRSIEISPTDVSVMSIAKIVIFFVILAAVFFYALRNFVTALRRFFISKLPLHVVSILLSLTCLYFLVKIGFAEVTQRI